MNPETESRESEPSFSGKALSVELSSVTPESFLGIELSTEIQSQIDSRLEVKNHRTDQTTESLSQFKQALETGDLRGWAIDGRLVEPVLIGTETQQQILDIIEHRLDSEAASEARNIAMFREFLSKDEPTQTDIKVLAKQLGVEVSAARLKLSGKYREQICAKLSEGALNVPGVALEDEQSGTMVVKDAVVTERHKALWQWKEAIRDPRLRERATEVEDQLREPVDIDTAYRVMTQINQADEAARRQVIERVQSGELEAVLHGLHTGAITLEDLKADLTVPGDCIVVTASVRSAITRAIKEPSQTYPEPSLAGYRFGPQEQAAVSRLFNAASEAGKLAGESLDTSQAMSKLLEEVEAEQTRLQERIDDANALYWHFSPAGLAIIESKALKPGADCEVAQLTASHSQGTHFVKTGDGLDTGIDYSGYAEVTRRFGDGQPIPDALGLGVIFPLGSIVEQTPWRDEPSAAFRGRGNVAEDVVFRSDDGSVEYNYPLQDAYLLPQVSNEQLSALEADPRFKDLFESRHELRTKGVLISYAIFERALMQAGYSGAWVKEHLVDPLEIPELHDPHISEADRYRAVNRLIHQRMERATEVIIPVLADHGNFESHDLSSGNNSGNNYREKLISVKR